MKMLERQGELEGEHVIWNSYREPNLSPREKTKKLLLWLVTMLIIIVGIGGLLVFSYYFSNRCYTHYEVVSEVERSDSNNVTYQYFQKNLLKYSQSGISQIDYKGKTLWNGGYEMKQAQVDTCENMVLASDVGGTSFHIYNGQDEGAAMETTFPIVRGKVSSQGLAAILEQDSESNTLKIYNPYSNTMKLLVEIPTNVSEDGYPFDYDISPDGTTVVASYITTEGTQTGCRVNFYNFSDVGQDRNMLVGGKDYGENMISGIEFIDGDRVAVFHEKGVDVFTNMKQPKLLFDKSFDRIILSMAYSKDYIAVVTADETMEKKILDVYDEKGETVLSTVIDYEYTDLKIYGDELYFTGSHHVDVMRINGKPKFSVDFDIEVDGFFPGGTSIDYLVVDYNYIKKIRMKSR